MRLEEKGLPKKFARELRNISLKCLPRKLTKGSSIATRSGPLWCDGRGGDLLATVRLVVHVGGYGQSQIKGGSESGRGSDDQGRLLKVCMAMILNKVRHL